jgi:thioredoxin reductase (NADPH)
VVTGTAVERARQLETSCEGIFAIGDVRAGSVKRVAAAVGDGAGVVAEVHGYLAAKDRDVADSLALTESRRLIAVAR